MTFPRFCLQRPTFFDYFLLWGGTPPYYVSKLTPLYLYIVNLYTVINLTRLLAALLVRAAADYGNPYAQGAHSAAARPGSAGLRAARQQEPGCSF